MTVITYHLPDNQATFTAPNDGNQVVVNAFGPRHHITTTEMRDWVYGGDSDITAYTKGGDDILQLNGGNATIYSGSGEDWVTIGRYDAAERAYVIAGDGNDDIEIDAETATLYGDNGDDFMDVSADTASLYGGTGDDSLDFYGDRATIYGGAGHDWMRIIGDGYVDAGSGNDVIHIGLGADSGGFSSYAVRALGGEGNDTFTIQTQVAYWGHTVTLEGGNGDDSYHGVGNSSHTMSIVEGANGGTDTAIVLLGASHTLAANVENLRVDETVYGSNSRVNDWETPSGGGLLQGNGLNNLMIGSSRGQELRGHAGNDSIAGRDGNDILKGGTGNDSLDGESGTDTLYGEDGDDRLVIEGSDRGYGGYGDDTYVVSSATAHIVEGLDAGHDTVVAKAQNYVLGIDFEELHLTSPVVFQSGEGNYRDNTILGSSGANLILGHAGNDLLQGGGGTDTVYGGAGRDNIRGDTGNDILGGDAGDDILNGGTGNDSLSGGDDIDFLLGDTGNDTLDGGTGDDLLSGGTENDLLRGSDGRDILYGGDGNDHLYGGLLNDSLRGDAGDDVLDGGLGDDQMRGGLGNDRYYVTSLFDVIEEAANSGIDEVRTYLDTHTLGANVENLQSLYGGNFRGYGNTLANVIEADDGNDQLFGGGGNDILYGGYGNDYLNGGDDDDVLHGGLGSDTLYGGGGNNTLSYAYETAAVKIDLRFGTATGGAAGDQFFAIANLTGSRADDVLRGDIGANRLDGGSGNDVLVGRGGADTFVFTAGFAAGGYDRITDFVFGTDTLVLAEGLENLRAVNVSGGAELRFDLDGGSHAIRLDGHTRADLLAGFDFV